MEIFAIVNPKHPDEEFYVDIDIDKWLADDTIKSVSFSAKTSKGVPATSTVLDLTKCTFNGVHVRPYIKDGTAKIDYKVYAAVVGNAISDVGMFVVKFSVKE